MKKKHRVRTAKGEPTTVYNCTTKRNDVSSNGEERNTFTASERHVVRTNGLCSPSTTITMLVLAIVFSASFCSNNRMYADAFVDLRALVDNVLGSNSGIYIFSPLTPTTPTVAAGAASSSSSSPLMSSSSVASWPPPTSSTPVRHLYSPTPERLREPTPSRRRHHHQHHASTRPASANLTFPNNNNFQREPPAEAARGGAGGILINVKRLPYDNPGDGISGVAAGDRWPRTRPTIKTTTTTTTLKRAPKTNSTGGRLGPGVMIPTQPSSSTTNRTARSPSPPPLEGRVLIYPEREGQRDVVHHNMSTATPTPLAGGGGSMPRGNGSTIESVPHVFNPYLGVGPQHNILTITEAPTSTTSTLTSVPGPDVVHQQKMKPIINFVNVVAGRPMGLVDVFHIGGQPPPAVLNPPPPVDPTTTLLAVGAPPLEPSQSPFAESLAPQSPAALQPHAPPAGDGASSNPVVIPTDVTGPPGLEMPAFDIPVTDPKVTVNENNQSGYQQNTWREFLEEIADECPNNDMLRAEEIGPERFAGKTNPPKGVTIAPSLTTRSPEFFVESVDAGKGGHICLWAKQMLTKMGHVDRPPPGQPQQPSPTQLPLPVQPHNP